MRSQTLSRLATILLTIALAGCGGGQDEMMTPDLPAGDLPDLAPDDGWTFHTGHFEVKPGEELQDCFFVAAPDLNNGQPYYIDHIVSSVAPVSHHMNVFRVRTIRGLDGEPGEVVHSASGEGPCFVSSNWSDWPLVTNSQNSNPDDPIVDWQLPDGVAHKFTPGEKLMIQTHYFNFASPTSFMGNVSVQFNRTKSENPIELGTLFATQQNIRICESIEGPQKFSGHCSFPADQGSEEVHIAAANGHFHARGKEFDMYAWDGQSLDEPSEDAQFYANADWTEPPMVRDIDVKLQPGQGIWWNCVYEWSPPFAGCDEVNANDPEMANDCCYTFGPEVARSEHCNAFIYYWPKTEDIFCN